MQTVPSSPRTTSIVQTTTITHTWSRGICVTSNQWKHWSRMSWVRNLRTRITSDSNVQTSILASTSVLWKPFIYHRDLTHLPQVPSHHFVEPLGPIALSMPRCITYLEFMWALFWIKATNRCPYIHRNYSQYLPHVYWACMPYPPGD